MTECLSCLCLCVRMFLSGSLAKMDFFSTLQLPISHGNEWHGAVTFWMNYDAVVAKRNFAQLPICINKLE